MRHGKKHNHLGRKTAHRKALLRNLSIALFTNKRINTTLAKAKALRVHAEPLITKSRKNTMHNRRVVFGYLQDKDAVNELFGPIAEAVGDRAGGYLRVIKTGFRKGDAAEMAMIELVDFNKDYDNGKETGKKRTRRGRKKAESTAVDTAKASSSVGSAETDDFTKIEGIGPKISGLIKAAGISTFAELGNTDVDQLKSILADAGSRYATHDPTTWAEQSSMAAAGKWDELKKWQDELDGGKVANTSSEEG